MKKTINAVLVSKLLLPTILLLVLASVTKSFAYCPAYFAFVDQLKSDYPRCLKISGGMFCGGDLEVINECPNDVVLDDKTIKANDTAYGFKAAHWDYDSSEQNKQHWSIKGMYNGEQILVSGHTSNWENKNSVERVLLQIPYVREILLVSASVVVLFSLLIIRKRRV